MIGLGIFPVIADDGLAREPDGRCRVSLLSALGLLILKDFHA
jgi:hypothetical protein